MTKQQKNIAIGVVIALMVIGFVLFLVLRPKKPKPGVTPTPGTTPSGGGTGNVNSPNQFPLGIGSSGNLVKGLQTKFNAVVAVMNQKGVNSYGLKTLTVDGNWGPKTDSAFSTITGLAGQPLTSVASQTQYNEILADADRYINYLNAMGNASNGVSGSNESWFYNLFNW
jgi:hypothetical protein